MTSKPRLFSGMQPSANSLHIGNYIGALLQWKEMQATYDAYFCIVDLHALTVAQDPTQLRANTRRTAAQYIAAGIDPTKSTLFVQSHVAAHPELAWVLNTIAGFGEASRMTQFKDKSAKQGAEGTTVGLFAYPMLMAADILCMTQRQVPVGDDQRQHVELTRDLAGRFNTRFSETFVVPEAMIMKETARIYDLQDPTSKMSKSATSQSGTVWMMDEPSVTVKKIKSAVTDAGREIRNRGEKPGVANLLTIYSRSGGQNLAQLEDEYAGHGYGELKNDLAEVVVETFAPIRKRTLELLDDPAELDRVLAGNADRAASIANATLAKVYDRIGLLPRG